MDFKSPCHLNVSVDFNTDVTSQTIVENPSYNVTAYFCSDITLYFTSNIKHGPNSNATHDLNTDCATCFSYNDSLSFNHIVNRGPNSKDTHNFNIAIIEDLTAYVLIIC